MHEERIPAVICRLIRKIYEMNYLMLHRLLGLALIAIADPPSPTMLTPHQDGGGFVEYQIPEPEQNYNIPEQIRIDAISSFKRYLQVPEDCEVLDNCLVFIFDPDERPRF